MAGFPSKDVGAGNGMATWERGAALSARTIWEALWWSDCFGVWLAFSVRGLQLESTVLELGSIGILTRRSVFE